MTKTKTTKAVGDRKAAFRTTSAKKRVRRVMFTSDQWYASAAMSIGIAKRSKAARQPLVSVGHEEAD